LDTMDLLKDHGGVTAEEPSLVALKPIVTPTGTWVIMGTITTHIQSEDSSSLHQWEPLAAAGRTDFANQNHREIQITDQ